MEKCGICSKSATQLFETGTDGVFACYKCQPLIPEVSIGQDDNQETSQPGITNPEMEVVVVSEDQDGIPEGDGEVTADLVCNLCHKGFDKNIQLQNHLRNHLAERKFVCTYCNKAFSQSNNLRAHLRIHTNERPFKCTLCDKAFTQVTNLNNHFRLHTGERPYACDEPGCTKAFAQVTNLNQHRKRHINGKPVDIFYSCSACGEQFEQRNHMTEHRRAVHGLGGGGRSGGSEKRGVVVLAFTHVCHVCSDAFTTEPLLQAHMATHADTLPDRDPLADDDSDDDELNVAPLKCMFSGCSVRSWTAAEQSAHLLRAHQLRVRSPPQQRRRRGRPPKMQNKTTSNVDVEKYHVEIENRIQTSSAKSVKMFP